MDINIRYIAEKTGFSVATVSKALNGYPDISEKTRKIILDTVKELGYTPNSVARSLRTSKNESIGLFIINQHSMSDYTGEYYFNLMKSIAFAAGEQGYNLLLYAYRGDQIENIRRLCKSREVGGLIITGGGDTDNLVSYCKDISIPIVILNRTTDNPDITSIKSDNFQGGLDIVRHLFSTGKKRIGYIGNSDDRQTNSERLSGYKEALRTCGISYDPMLVIETESSSEKITAAAEKMMSSQLDAIFTFNDRYALNIMAYLENRGVRIPEDVALAGFDDIQSDLLVTPNLTTIRQPFRDLGSKAVDVIVNRINGECTGADEIVLPVELVIRGSSVKSGS